MNESVIVKTIASICAAELGIWQWSNVDKSEGRHVDLLCVVYLQSLILFVQRKKSVLTTTYWIQKLANDALKIRAMNPNKNVEK